MAFNPEPEMVDSIYTVKEYVSSLVEEADENEALDGENLLILEAQLDALHQAASVASAQSRASGSQSGSTVDAQSRQSAANGDTNE